MGKQLPGECAASPRDLRSGLVERLLSFEVGAMLVRNTVVSTFAFFVGLGLLWLLVNRCGTDPIVAAGIGFVVSNTMHYVLGRSWIFRGSARSVGSGYALFLVNAGAGLGLTMALYAAMLRYTGIGYIWARVLVSLIAGLVVFLLNAVLNFRQV
jgi:putative flippase GtrA